MSRTRHLVAAGVIRAGRRHVAVAFGCRPVQGVNLLDTSLGVAGDIPARPLMAIAEPEPDLSARYRVPSRPAEPVDRVRAGRALARALQGLDLDHDSFRLLTWVDSWSAANKAALASLVEAARTAGVAR
jgi:hypothetical protein